MFDMLGDMAKGFGRALGTITGTIIGLPLIVVAEALGITIEMVKEAKDAGCETYEEIREFFDLDK